MGGEVRRTERRGLRATHVWSRRRSRGYVCVQPMSSFSLSCIIEMTRVDTINRNVSTIASQDKVPATRSTSSGGMVVTLLVSLSNLPAFIEKLNKRTKKKNKKKKM